MQRKDIKEVLNRVRSGNYTSEDETVTKYWIHQFHQDDDVQLSNKEWLEIENKIWAGLETEKVSNRPVLKRIYPFIISAAAILAIVASGIFFFNLNNYTGVDSSLIAHDVAPGTVSATLTLANGKKMKLADVANGKIAVESGITVTKAANGELIYQLDDVNASDGREVNTLSTARGETYSVVLPDKSRVWLNAASSLTYSASSIKTGKRMVKLHGEGYFEIAKDRARPFIVETEQQKVEVLGTHFNINSYKDEQNTVTTLLEGSVRVSALAVRPNDSQGSVSTLLRPNQQSELSLGGVIAVKPANVEGAIAWKEGYFDFNEERLESIMNKIARWYDLTVVYENPQLKEQAFTGNISKFSKVTEVLKKLALSDVLNFSVEGRKIIVKD